MISWGNNMGKYKNKIKTKGSPLFLSASSQICFIISIRFFCALLKHADWEFDVGICRDFRFLNPVASGFSPQTYPSSPSFIIMPLAFTTHDPWPHPRDVIRIRNSKSKSERATDKSPKKRKENKNRKCQHREQQHKKGNLKTATEHTHTNKIKKKTKKKKKRRDAAKKNPT